MIFPMILEIWADNLRKAFEIRIFASRTQYIQALGHCHLAICNNHQEHYSRKENQKSRKKIKKQKQKPGNKKPKMKN